MTSLLEAKVITKLQSSLYRSDECLINTGIPQDASASIASYQDTKVTISYCIYRAVIDVVGTCW